MISKSRRVESGVLEKIGQAGVIVEVNAAGMYGIGSDPDIKVLIGTVGVIRDISERKRSEMQIRRQTEVLEAINKIFLDSMASDTEEQVADSCLSAALSLTNSRFGLIGEKTDKNIFRAIALRDSEREECRIADQETKYPLHDAELKGVLADLVQGNRFVFYNHIESDSEQFQLPLGHPRFTSFLGGPLRHANSMSGVIALANKPDGYGPEDRKAVESLAAAFVESL